MQGRDQLYTPHKSLKIFWVSVSLCLWTILSPLLHLNQSKGLYLATICSGEGKSIIVVGIEGKPIKWKTWCLDCTVQGLMAEQSFSIAELILNEHKAACKALKASLDKLQAVQYYFQTGPPEIV